MRAHVDPVATTSSAVHVEDRRAGTGLRIFQILAALAGGVLFVLGLVAVFEVDFGGQAWKQTTAEVAGFGFSAVSALAAIVLGGAILVATLADQDRGTTSFLGLLTLVVGIVGLVVQENAEDGFQVARDTAALFIVLGAAAFVLSLVPWWTRRRTTTYVER